jgi:hypothetical protein
VVLALDTYEVFGLMDTWLRQVFLPALGDNVRVLLVGRRPPGSAWLTSPGWQDLFRALALGPLPDSQAAELLSRCGIADADHVRRIHRFTHGHPLALKLVASAIQQRPELDLEAMALPRAMDELVGRYLEGVDDPIARRALDVASVVRRTTRSLLRAALPDLAPQDAFERLRALPFVEASRDGLILHDAVQPVICAALRAADPTAYASHRRAAWRQLRSELRTAGGPDLWRYTADMLYLIENPVVREAFFPSGGSHFAVEAARPEDARAIHEIVEQHDGPEAARILARWWARAPAAFQAVRDRDGSVAGFYCMCDPTTVDQDLLREDAVARAWCEHVRRHPPPQTQRVLFLRRWLSRADGEAPSPVQAACWLDVKRAYMELRPDLRRVYLAVHDLPTYAPTALKLRFHPLPEATVAVADTTYHTAMLDFGPSSVDGWLCALVQAELGTDDPDVLDVEARELLVDGRRVPLTRLEFELMLYLYQREGKAIARAALLEDVWGYGYDGGSNVVDVVVRALRKKLGAHAALIETVSGVGYRFRRP